MAGEKITCYYFIQVDQNARMQGSNHLYQLIASNYKRK
uniref:Uncharacterized protein n=1 Tax=Tetranychus urticae TaxID=32264 RepID=T1KZ37_TETUR